MTTPLALFNGSYVGQRPTGIGVVARDLAAALDPAMVPAIWPEGLSPDHGTTGHWRRLQWTQWQLPRLWRASGAPLLLSPLPEAPFAMGVPAVVLVHDLLPLRYPQLTPLLAYHLAYVPLVLHRARHVLCNSEATAREVHSRLRLPLARLSVLRLGFAPGQLRPLQLQRQPFLLVLGRHDPHKNLSRLLRAFAQMRERNISIRFVGPHDRRYTPRLQSLARELGVADRCDWIAWVSDGERLELLNRASALVIASLWEGFGLPALEAMACGTPVLASTAGALPEVVGEAALPLDPRNPDQMAAAMDQLLRDSPLAASLAAAGPPRAALFNWPETARQLEQRLQLLAR
jgi:glycosyltransferase involved in cell wall biosynthesis